MSKIKIILMQRRTWMTLGIAGLVVFLYFAMTYAGDRFNSGALGKVRDYMLLMLIVPAGMMLKSYVQMVMDDQIHQRVRSLVGEDVDSESSSRRSSEVQSSEQAAAVKDEVASVSGNLQSALTTLRKRRFGAKGGRWLYQLPWYAVIGPSGSGKTTAILNSGLRFPLAGRHGNAPLRGIGGTRHCDWWFTDDAVLIDTAGRYTTQEEPTGPERGAWLGFLGLLRKHRRREPINGVMIVVGMDLLLGPEAVRHDQAMRIRDRVRELYDELQMRIPVYVIVSKIDLLEGFVEYFDDLGAEGRDAVWGITFDLPQPDAEGRPTNPGDAFVTEFDALIDSLDGRLVDRLQHETDSLRRLTMFGFPQRVASLRNALDSFLQDTFSPNSFEDPILLRGIYMASSTQSPPAFGGILGKIDPAFQKARTSPDRENRCFFLNRLLRDVIFGEAGLVATDPAKARRRRVGMATGHIAILAGAVLISGLLLAGYFRASAAASDFMRDTQAVSEELAALNPEEVQATDFQQVVGLLSRLGQARDQAVARGGPGHVFDRAGRLASQADRAYAHALEKVLAPRLVLAVEQAMTRERDDAIALYPALKTYLLLGGRGPADPEFVRRWMASEALNILPGPEAEKDRQALAHHAAAWMAMKPKPMELEEQKITEARGALPGGSAAARVVAQISESEQAAALRPWRLVENAGPEAGRVFRDRRGDLTASAVPGIYTRAGFYQVFLPQLSAAARGEASELWVLEDRPDAANDDIPALTARLGTDATQLYLRETALRWDETLGAVSLQPLQSLEDALRVMNTLSAPTSPVRLLLVSVVAETAFDRVPEAPAAKPAQDGTTPPADPLAGDAVAEQAQKLAANFAVTHFREIRGLVEVPGNSQSGALPPIDQVIADLGLLYRQLRDIQSAEMGGPLDSSGESGLVMRQVAAGAARLPEPVHSWITDVSTTSVDRSASSARDLLNRRWLDGPAEMCSQVTRNRYPFTGGARTEVDMATFGQLFGPGGELDRFTKANLDNIIDRSGPTWKWRASESLNRVLNPEALVAMQQAERIRNAMFSGNGARPSVGFQLSVLDGADNRAGIRVSVNGQSNVFKGGGQSVRMHWPGAEGMGQASISLPQFMGSREPGLAATGDWSVYRLLDRAATRSASTETGVMRVGFEIGDKRVTLVLQSDGAPNPLDRRMLAAFRCPETFLMRAIPQPGRICAFGKIPARPDFITLGLSPATKRIWDDWLQDGMGACQALYGEDWKLLFRQAPVWHVVLPFDVIGGAAVVGLMLPSMDAVGRQFPLFMGVEMPAAFDALPIIAGSSRWFAALGALALDALDPSFDPTEIMRRVLPRWQAGILPAVRAEAGAPAQTGEGLAIELPMASAAASLAQGIFGNDAARRCLFWTTGSTVMPPVLAIAQALPSAQGFVALVDGDWQRHGWKRPDTGAPSTGLDDRRAAPADDAWDRDD